jgi:hypothetical protein
MVITGRQTSREIRENILNSNRDKRAGSEGESNPEEQEERRSIIQFFINHVLGNPSMYFVVPTTGHDKHPDPANGYLGLF